MTEDTRSERLEGLASSDRAGPLIDIVREIAEEELPEPLTLKLTLWDDGDFCLRAYHTEGQSEREQVVLNPQTGEVWFQHAVGATTVERDVDDYEGTMIETEFEEFRERLITTVDL